MKTKPLCIATLLGLSVMSTVGFAQDQAILAVNETTIPEPSIEEPEDQAEEEQESPTFSFSGSVDTYFHTTFGTTNGVYGGINAPASAFADLKGFGLGMVNPIASYSGERAGFTADLVFGPRGRAAVFTSESSAKIPR